MKIDHSRILRITGVSVLILVVAVVLYLKESSAERKHGEVSTYRSDAQPVASDKDERFSTEGDRPSSEGDRPSNVVRNASASVTADHNPQVLPLSRNSNPTTEQCLEALVSSRVEADRVRAAMLLGQRAKQEGIAAKAVPALIRALDNDGAPQVSLVCAQALGKYGGDAAEAVPTLMKWFDHPTMRDVSVDALGDIGSAAQPALALMSPIAMDPQERFVSRRKAITAMVRIGGSGHPAVAETLSSAEADDDARIRLIAQEPLKPFQAVSPVPGTNP